MLKKSPTLEVYSDYIDPWCYYTLPTFQALNELGVIIRRRSFLTLPQISEQGISIDEYDNLRGNTKADRKRLDTIVQKMIKDQQLPWIERKFIYQSRPAHIISKWADSTAKGGEVFHREVFITNFGHGKNIGQLEVLKEIVEKIGLPSDQIATILQDEKYKQMVTDDIKIAKNMGIHSVPTYLCNNRTISGYLGIDELKNFIGI